MIATHSVSLAFTKAMRNIGGGFILPDPDQGAIIALKAKGDARHDTSGFVVR